MRKNLLCVFLVYCFCSACYGGEIEQRRLLGEWVFQGIVDKSSKVECPDLLTLKDDGSYLVLNDCYGVDIKNPVTEKGDWVLKGERNLILMSREFESNYYFFDDTSDPLKIKVVQILEEEMILQFKSHDPEIYKKIN